MAFWTPRAASGARLRAGGLGAEAVRRRAAAFRQRRLRGAACGGDMDADRGIGLGPDHLRQFARFSRTLRRARAGLDQEVLAARRLRRPVVDGRGLRLYGAWRRDLGPKRLDARQRSADTQSARRGRRWPQLLVDVARELALNTREARNQGLENTLQLREPRLGSSIGARLLGSELGEMGPQRGVKRSQCLRRVRGRSRLSLTQPL